MLTIPQARDVAVSSATSAQLCTMARRVSSVQATAHTNAAAITTRTTYLRHVQLHLLLEVTHLLRLRLVHVCSEI